MAGRGYSVYGDTPFQYVVIIFSTDPFLVTSLSSMTEPSTDIVLETKKRGSSRVRMKELPLARLIQPAMAGTAVNVRNAARQKLVIRCMFELLIVGLIRDDSQEFQEGRPYYRLV